MAEGMILKLSCQRISICISKQDSDKVYVFIYIFEVE